MGAAYNITVDDAEVMASLGRLSARAQDMTPTMDRIGMVLESSAIHRFDTGVDPDGAAWPA